MDEEHLEQRLANVAAAVADKTRAGMLCMLMDGRAYTATELAAATSVAASTASSHLARLTQQRLVECLPQGRHRYFRIAGKEVASALETLMGLVGGRVRNVQSATPVQLRFARTCYDHMAGEVAVALHDRLLDLGWLARESYQLCDTGRDALAAMGVDWPAASRRRFACGCLDWSERQSHLGGQLGAALLHAFERHRWVERVPESRQLLLTPRGRQALDAHFGLALAVNAA
ncbi:ArsR/SmtB family transcription factor [Silvimonas iriomotensis]|uniref:Transcriptional regulator n=1 Tax=Silvimonas iriomotensis TaxID=449662 RepID=A0ABQ2PAZ5_9NEIS|nr:helix-turn-helix transcriptional regulator [Silvimonas iriomotensis]GGP22377.1 transcriptional regulator [Silvimonas iriomotensis]